jgi:hypothetical protein
MAAKQLSDADNTISDTIRKIFDSQEYITKMPTNGLQSDQIVSKLDQYATIGKVDWMKGRASGMSPVNSLPYHSNTHKIVTYISL